MSLVISVHTPPTIRDFIIGRNGGSSLIPLKADDPMSALIIALLKRPPKDYKLVKADESSLINIQVNGFRIGNTKYSSEFRNYLSDRDQQVVVDRWKETFDIVFHTYVYAFCKGMKFKPPCQKRAIEDFCDIYDIDLDLKNYECLKKSWDRSKLKREHASSFKKMKKIITHQVPCY